MDDADQGVADAGGVERLQDRHGVAAATAAGVVGDVGEDQRRSAVVVAARRTASSRLVRVGPELVAPGPAGLGDLCGQRVGGVLVGGRHHDGQAVERGVGVGEAAHDRDVQHATGIGRLRHALLAEVDQFAVGPVAARPCR